MSARAKKAKAAKSIGAAIADVRHADEDKEMVIITQAPSCVLCFERYDEEKRMPKGLPCGHTFWYVLLFLFPCASWLLVLIVHVHVRAQHTS